MKAGKLGILSALVASVCCVGPVVLILLGLGGLGLGAMLGRYHWWFILAAVGLLVFAWRVYFKERGRCRAASCEMAQGKITVRALIGASVVVALFVGLNLSTYASQRHARPGGTSTKRAVEAAISVEGMTCFTCELMVESSLKRLPGVQDADARVTEHAAYVRYDPHRVNIDELIEAINQTGYRAKRSE
jgi:copper chaperone CopZ